MTQGDTQSTGTWQRLVSTALVGVNRRAVPEAPELPAAPDREPAAALLERAAAAVVQQRAGYVPATAEPVRSAPADPRPTVPDAAARHLDMLLANEHTTAGIPDHHNVRTLLLGEWLDAAAERGMRAPSEALPRLLDLGRSERDLRPKIAAEARARWLAGCNSDWGYVAGWSFDDRFDPEIWEHGGPAERRRTLAALRVEDPARARELLGQIWPGAKVERRRELLLTLETQLSAADEPFLERALDDRGATVRGAALALLARLPDSAHAERLCAHARHYVWRGAPNRGGDRRLRVAAPEPTDSDLARDLALVTKDTGQDSGDVSGEWLWALVTHTPLRFWPEHLDAAPAEVGSLAVKAGEWDLLVALGNAAAVQWDREWARAMLPAIEEFHRKPRSRRGQVPNPRSLLMVLPTEERCALVAQLLAEDRDRALRVIDTPRIPLLALGSRWTEELSERATEVIFQLVGTDLQDHLRGLCHAASVGMPLAMHERFTPVTSETHENMVELEATLRFRRQMHEEFG